LIYRKGATEMKRAIQDKVKTKRAVDPKAVAGALGAEDTGFKIDPGEGPLSLLALRRFLTERLQSTGGRPGLAGASKVRRKISFFEEDWDEILKIAEYYRKKKGLNVTGSQVAAALIHSGISRIDKKEDA
jgi:hypothetical protein